MRELKIMDTLKIGNNTLIAVDDPCEDIKNGSALLDDSGKPYVILSIGTNSNKNNINITNILIDGHIKSEKIFL